MGRPIDNRPRRVGRHLLVAIRWRGSLDLAAQKRQASGEKLAGQHERGDEFHECNSHRRNQYTSKATWEAGCRDSVEISLKAHGHAPERYSTMQPIPRSERYPSS